MAWTKITREHYRRDKGRYASDATDAEWALIAPHLPPPARLGGPRKTDPRAVVDATFFLQATGCQRRQLPKEFPPYSTVQVNCRPFRPDTWRKQEGSRISLRIGLCSRTISGSS